MFAFSDRLQLPPGFRFYPSDEELIVHYLKNKTYSTPLPASIIADIHLYKYNPWELPSLQFFFLLVNPLISFMFLFFLETDEPISLLPYMQTRLCLERMNGSSLVQEIGNTLME